MEDWFCENGEREAEREKGSDMYDEVAGRECRTIWSCFEVRFWVLEWSVWC